MQFLLTKGLAFNGRGGGARATNMIYTNMLFALGLDKIVFGQSPGLWSLLGSGLILGSAVFVAVKKGSANAVVVDDDDDEERGATQEEEMAMLGAHGEMLDEDVERAALRAHGGQRLDEEAELGT